MCEIPVKSQASSILLFFGGRHEAHGRLCFLLITIYHHTFCFFKTQRSTKYITPCTLYAQTIPVRRYCAILSAGSCHLLLQFFYICSNKAASLGGKLMLSCIWDNVLFSLKVSSFFFYNMFYWFSMTSRSPSHRRWKPSRCPWVSWWLASPPISVSLLWIGTLSRRSTWVAWIQWGFP